MLKQSLETQKGEIDFRNKLTQHQVYKSLNIPDEYDSESINNILKERMNTTFNQMSSLIKSGVMVSPFLEIGAERGQRSLVMGNNFKATGIAADLSYHMLKSCGHYAQTFNKPKLPIRLCCDANYLPIASNSIPFIFCYETLHHFPDPTPIINEVNRVLCPGGHFYLAEEPYRRILHLDLYKAGKIYSNNLLNTNAFLKFTNFFFASKSCNETEYGITENHDISIKQWKNMLNLFDDNKITLRSVNFIKTDLFTKFNFIKYFFSFLLGGTINGICKKKGSINSSSFSSFPQYICPLCHRNGKEINLNMQKDHFICSTCSEVYPIIDNILFLLTLEQRTKLYPELFN